MAKTLSLTRTFAASPKAVYRAFTTPGGQMDWFANSVNLDARVGGRIYLWTETGYQAMGTFTDLQDGKLVAFDLFNPRETHVKVSIDQQNGETTVTVEQSIDTDEQLKAAREGWEGSLENLKSVLESGQDRRFYDRPMLGILIGGLLDDENKARYEAPVEKGIIVSGTVPGMGAEALGLQEDDVLVEMDGIALEDFPALQKAIRPHKAGDSVKVVWYRGGEKHTGDMTLSGRPVPAVPATPADLAEEIRSIYARLDTELAEILEGVSEEEAEYRPAEHEWNAKEILAHIIAVERATQIWIVNTAEGQLFNNWGTNHHHLIKSIVDIHPTLPHLSAELRRTEGQTVALLGRLPDDLVNFKGAFHNIATTLGKDGLPIHTRLHYENIKKLVAEARAEN